MLPNVNLNASTTTFILDDSDNVSWVNTVTPAGHTATTFQWNTPNGTVTATGAGLVYSGVAGDSRPTAGTITQITISLTGATQDVTITNLNVDATLLTTDTGGSESANRFWATVLDGQTVFTSSATEFERVHGDFVDVNQILFDQLASMGTLAAADDNITGGNGFSGSILIGDVWSFNANGIFLGGNDTVVSTTSSTSNNTIFGDANDTSSGTLIGGNDTLTLMGAAGFVSGDVGSFLGILNGGNDIITGHNGGNDTLIGDTQTAGGSGAAAMLNGGDDQLFGRGGNDTLYGDYDQTNYNGDVLAGGNDILDGGAGNDKLFGNEGNDTLRGGFGIDQLFGQDGVDRLFGGGQNDTLRGGNQGDVLRGENGNDFLFGENGADFLYGGGQNDVLRGGGQADALRGENGNDFLFGDNGNDRLFGGGQNDVLRGGGQNDLLFGENGNDRMFGEGGNDLLVGGFGRDVMDGGFGRDRFDYNNIFESRGALRDLINGFQRNIDDIDLRTIDANTQLAGNQKFSFIGNAAFSGSAGELHIRTVGSLTKVEGDINGDGAADFTIDVAGTTPLSASDFFL